MEQSKIIDTLETYQTHGTHHEPEEGSTEAPVDMPLFHAFRK